MVDIVGCWELISFNNTDKHGKVIYEALGSSPTGLLIYTKDGYVSVNMMRNINNTQPTDSKKVYMSYAGHWYQQDNHITHVITISPDTHMIGKPLVRKIQLCQNYLTIEGGSFIKQDEKRYLKWRRIA